MNYRRLFATAGVIGLLTSSISWSQFQRNVVIEEFTSVTCIPCVTATKVMNEVMKEKGERVISVRYHMNIPEPGDPWYKPSKGDIDARSDMYYVLGIPHARVNGQTAAPQNKADLLTAVNETLRLDPLVGINVTQAWVEGDSVNVSVDVTAESDGLGDDYKLYIAVVEDFIYEEERVEDLSGYNGETEFFDVFRAFINSNGAHGEEITLNPDQKKTIQHSYTIDGDWQAEELFVVAFVQDEFSLEVVQSGYSPKLTLSVTEPYPMAGYAFEQIIPNPATLNARVKFSLGNGETGILTLHDANGALLRKTDLGKLEAGDHVVEVETAKLSAGVYTMTLRAGEYRASQKLLVVQ